MKKIVLIGLIMFSVMGLFAQNGVFQTHNSAMLYSDTTIKQLTKIVDSLNRSFAASNLNTTYYSKQQALGHYVKVNKERVREALKDIENNISYEDFLNQYPNADLDDNIIIIKSLYKDDNNNDVVEFISLSVGKNLSYNFTFKNQAELYTKKLHNSWVFEYSDEDPYFGESVEAFYFAEEFQSIPIPDKYANYIRYSDYLIDTNTQIYFENAFHDKPLDDSEATERLIENMLHEDAIDVLYLRDAKKGGDIEKFMLYVDEKTKRPQFKDFEKRKDFMTEFNKWDSLKFQIIDKKLAKSRKFNQLLKKAYQEAILEGVSNDDFETLVGRYISKEKELFLRRNRRCGLHYDSRDHALKIAILAAETLNWDLFLRSHLDILVERYEDNNNHAQEKRYTYMKELEEIKINIPDLFLGVSLKIENPATNHYHQNNIDKTAFALAESKYKDELEKAMLNAIADDELDDYNRILIYELFVYYTCYLKDEERIDNNIIRLQEVVNELPDYLAIRIQNENYQFERLLRHEIALIHQNFIISDPFVGPLWVRNIEDSEEYCWNAFLTDRKEVHNLKFEVVMDYDSKPGSIQPLIEQKDAILQRVHNASFLVNLLKEDPNKELWIHFRVNKSFSDSMQENFLRDLSESGIENLNYQLDNTILLNLIDERKRSVWLLFPNGDIMLWEFGGSSPLEQYTKEQLQRESPSSTSSEKKYWTLSFRLFDENGNLKE